MTPWLQDMVQKHRQFGLDFQLDLPALSSTVFPPAPTVTIPTLGTSDVQKLSLEYKRLSFATVPLTCVALSARNASSFHI